MTAVIIVAYAIVGLVAAYLVGKHTWHDTGYDGNKPGSALFMGFFWGLWWPLTAVVFGLISLQKFSPLRKFVTMLYGESRKVKQ